jgi:DNA-binding response OmpR family regulator
MRTDSRGSPIYHLTKPPGVAFGRSRNPLDGHNVDLLFCVLVVDDDAEIVDSAVELFTRHGFHAVGAYGGAEAIRVAAADPPDVALVDLAMPGVSGFEVARQLLAAAADRPPVLMAVTGLASEWDRELSYREGFALHLVKPIPPRELLTAVSAVRAGRERRTV